ncbi:MAG: hypothetical protein IPH07_07120 [Deltaproteobacteria bacterium]|nr:hypothetical protein [Deltaproteobacteria bacterium]
MTIARTFAAATLALTLAAPAAAAQGDVHFLVLRENGAGSPATAQTYLDSLMVHVAKANGWTAASGSYQTKRAAAKTYVEANKPEFGILSLGAYLALRDTYKLAVVGQAEIEGGGGAQYYVISKHHTDLAGCKGKTLASNHAGDVPFIEKVVAAGAFSLSDFTIVTTTRPVQTLKKVLKDEAECALVDDAQMAELRNLVGEAEVHPVWFSAALPPMPVVAFGVASADAVTTFKGSLGSICAGEGEKACAAAGLKSLRAVEASAYESVTSAYAKKK